MDSDQGTDHNLLKIKEKLNQNKVKLWLSPYLNDKAEVNENEMKNLALIYSSQLSIPYEICLECMHKLQVRALDNLREQNNYQNTGLAALKVRLPNEQGIGRIIKIHLELSKTGIALKEAVSTEISVPVERLKLIFQGKILKDEETLESQGVKHGLQIMAIILESEFENEEENYRKQLDSVKDDIKLLVDDRTDQNYLQVADQSGNLIKLPKKERMALTLAMTLHEKGRAAIKREDFALALVLLLEAEKEFSYCNSTLLKSVDNYGLLNLDIVWCYLNLESVTQLPDAEQRLHQCELNFELSYGPNLERLIALKGSARNENALFTRLHLLQAIVLFHKNKINESRELLFKVEEELKHLEVDDFHLSHLIELGYSAAEARLALRQANGDLDVAVNIIENKRLERKKNEEAEKKERELKKEKKKLGKCVNGNWIEPQFHKALMSMGYSYEVARWALAQSCNSISEGVNLIQDHPELSPALCQNITDDLIAQVAGLGFELKAAKLALQKHKGNVNKAIEELVANNGEVLDFNGSSSSSSSSSSSDSGSGSSSGENSPSTSKRKRDEAYSRVSEGISNYVEDHLDLNLVAEKNFLQKYKDLLSKWNN